MKLTELQLKAFGKFHNKTLELQPSVNIIEGQNEAGKSTIHAFIGAVLFGLDKTSVTDNRYKKYKPWLDRGNFGGAIRFEEAGREYYLERNFATESIELTEIGTGKTLRDEAAQSRLTEILGGLSEIGYANTVSIDQMKGTTDETIADELRVNLENLSRARSTSLDIKEAERFLKGLRDELEYNIEGYDATAYEQSEAKVAASEAELETAIREGWKASIEYNEAATLKKNAYQAYEDKREELLSRRENIDREQAEIRNQQAIWNKTDEVTKLLLKKREQKAERLIAGGKDPVLAFKPAIGVLWFVFALTVCVVAAAIALYFLWQQENYLLYAAGGAGAIAIIVLIICIVKLSSYKKKKGFYRSLLERKSRQEEYKRAGKALDEARNAVFMEMTSEQTGDYMKACERFDAAEKAYELAEKQMNESAKALDSAKLDMYAAAKAEREIKAYRDKLNAVNMAWEHLYAAGDISVRTFGEELKSKAGEYIKTITEGKYHRLYQNEYGMVCLEGRDGSTEISSVSRGTMEQVYLCLRLAATALLSPKVNLPIILDDTFAYYDDERTKRALMLLKDCGHQIILMTCQSREKKIMDEL